MADEFQPYVGPRPFEREDQALFFGRQGEARDLLSLVIAHQDVLFYAQSGAGKTSLLNARLIPMLEQKGFEVFPTTRVGGMLPEKIKPEEIPNIYVFNTLMSWMGDKTDAQQVMAMSLADFLKERERPADTDEGPFPRVIIFDQFEELFTSYLERWEEREGFFAQMHEALERDLLLPAVFAMREDYIAQLDPYVPFFPEKLRTRFRLERLSGEAALEAITGPLRATRCSFAPGVAEKLVEDLLQMRVETDPGEIVEVRGEFVEPVQLQVVCQSLWRDLPSHVTQITENDLEAFGDVDLVLSRFYDEAIRATAEKSHVDEGRLRSWCRDVLITSLGTRGTVYRARESTGGIPNVAIDVLENNHLIRAEWRAGTRWYELTHDRFIEPIRTSNAYLSRTMEQQDSQDTNRKANQALTRAGQAWGAGDYDRALTFCRDARANYEAIPDQWGVANTLLNMGAIYYEMKNYEEAIRCFTQAIQREPPGTFAYPWNGLGNVYADIGRPDEAIAAYQQAIALDPKHANPWLGLGTVYAEMGRPDEAIDAYQKNIALNPRSAASRVSLAACYRKLGQETEYSEQLSRARESIAQESEYDRACFEALSGNVEQALVLLKGALEIKKVSPTWVKRDLDLECIRDDPRFQALVAGASTK